jgi:hypothetical protein
LNGEPEDTTPLKEETASPGDTGEHEHAEHPVEPQSGAEKAATPQDQEQIVREVLEKEKEKSRKRRRLKLIITLIITVVVVSAALLTFEVNPDLPATPGVTYPYTTTYEVMFPDGEKIDFFGTDIIALTDGNEAFMKIGTTRRKIAVNDVQTLSTRRMTVKCYGVTWVDVNYQVDAVYRGLVGNNLNFYLKVKTSEQIPEFIVWWVLPPDVHARPV